MRKFLKRVRNRLKHVLGIIGGTAPQVSSGYKELAGPAAGAAMELTNAWRSDEIPRRQRELVNRQLAEYRTGAANPVFDALVDVLKTSGAAAEGGQILEIGCSSGYYSEVLRLRGLDRLSYRGCDYSSAFVQLARECYPATPFDVGDATGLAYDSDAFDIVVSGCCILHIADYEKAIAEAARVSRKYVVFHRTPVLHAGGPVYYTKLAYGVETLEIHFNEQALVEAFVRNGLRLAAINTHAISWDAARGDALAQKTYLCVK